LPNNHDMPSVLASSHHGIGLTTFCGRAGDHNDLAMVGAVTVGMALSKRLGVSATIIGTPDIALKAGWETELAEAMPALLALSKHFDRLFEIGLAPLAALSRCSVSLSTLPVLMRYRPDACVVWLDAHADLNTPQTSKSGYLGGMALAGPLGLWDSGLGNGLPLTSIILVGARDLDPAEQALVAAGGVRLVPSEGDYLSQLRIALAGRPAYIHLDCDVLEPGIVPTDYRVAGGFSLTELHAICKVLAESEVVGLEIAEFENSWAKDGEAVSPDALLDALEPIISRLGVSGVIHQET
jgi:arginase